MTKNSKDAPENLNETKVVESVTEETEIDVENIDIVALAQSKMEEYKALAQRTQADFDNFRKRNVEAVKQARVDGGNDVVLSMLPVLDTVEIAINMIADDATKSGVQLIQKKFQEVFAKYGESTDMVCIIVDSHFQADSTLVGKIQIMDGNTRNLEPVNESASFVDNKKL